MSMFDSSYCGSIWHHGIKGQRWGIRRTPEELGHRKSKQNSVDNLEKSAKIVDGVYHSSKGFSVAAAKLSKYCLDPEKPHSKEFYDIGYQPSDADLLFQHIEDGFDPSKRSEVRISERGDEQYSMPMLLGVTSKKLFTTAWQIDKDLTTSKLVTAYRDRRNKKG